MKFVVDAQLPPLLAERLRGLGADILHVEELALLDAADSVIWDRAGTDQRIIVTKDSDFAGWAIVRKPAVQVIWLRGGNQRNAALVAEVIAAWPQIVRSLEGGALVVEVGR